MSQEPQGPLEHAHTRTQGSPSASQLLAFSPGKEKAAGVWETCLAPGWPQLRSRLPFGPPGPGRGGEGRLGADQGRRPAAAARSGPAGLVGPLEYSAAPLGTGTESL